MMGDQVYTNIVMVLKQYCVSKDEDKECDNTEDFTKIRIDW